MKAVTLIRLLLTLALIYGAYTETGKWTAITLFLIGLNAEIAVAGRQWIGQRGK